MNEHIADSAALYALGALDETERGEVDAHVAHCAACTELLAAAEADVTRIAACEPQHAPARKPRWNSALITIAGIAALLIIAVLPSAYLLRQNLSMHAAMANDAAAVARIASAPHRTVAFAGMPGTDARVVYGRTGSWYCIVVRGITAPLRVLWMHDGKQTMLGTARLHGDIATLYLPVSHPMLHLALSDGQHVVANAWLPF